MILVLYIIGAVSFIISLVASFSSGSLMEFFILIAGGIASSIIFFALARVLEFQEKIFTKLEHQEEATKRSQSHKKRLCPKCNCEYDEECNSCPHCGYRD